MSDVPLRYHSWTIRACAEPHAVVETPALRLCIRDLAVALESVLDALRAIHANAEQTDASEFVRLLNIESIARHALKET